MTRLGLPALLTGIVALVIGCSPSPVVTRGQAVAPTSIECQVFYRSSLAEAPSDGRTIRLTTNNAREVIEFENLVLSAQALDDQFEGRSLVLSVTATDTGDQVMRQLYQIDGEKGLSNQFQGGHGFTGLGYVYHPTSPAELQYFCQAR
jgi:Asp/Glu/hydantoin racemase